MPSNLRLILTWRQACACWHMLIRSPCGIMCLMTEAQLELYCSVWLSVFDPEHPQTHTQTHTTRALFWWLSGFSRPPVACLSQLVRRSFTPRWASAHLGRWSQPMEKASIIGSSWERGEKPANVDREKSLQILMLDCTHNTIAFEAENPELFDL